ncbi:MAG: VirB3 family type IV secretion system protein [Rhodospirillaceae bacterium]|nr:VirB3 family type IV secretion system protein [Rhodospirillaceae bacterium]
MSQSIEGFETPLHHALTDPLLLAGAPRTMAIFIGAIAASLAFAIGLWITGLLFWVVFHTLAVVAAKRDPQFGEILGRHLFQKGHYSC